VSRTGYITIANDEAARIAGFCTAALQCEKVELVRLAFFTHAERSDHAELLFGHTFRAENVMITLGGHWRHVLAARRVLVRIEQFGRGGWHQ